MITGFLETTILNTTISCHDLEIYKQLKVCELLLTSVDDEGIAFSRSFFSCNPSNGAILDGPKFWVTIPVIEGLSVK